MFSILFFFIFFTTSTYAYGADVYVRPCGKAVGVKMYTDGLLIIDICPVTDVNGEKRICSDLNRGDIILSAQGQNVVSISSFKNIIDKNPNNITLSVKRHGSISDISVNPIMTQNGPSLGLWLRDSTAGVGTLTYYNPTSKTFGALGHGICDIDTSMLMPFRSGNIIECTVTDVKKSRRGAIGELECSFENENIGDLNLNTQIGIYGQSNFELSNSSQMRVADIEEVKEGAAVILAEVDEGGTKEYGIEIKKISDDAKNGRDMVVKVTDKDLIEKTGGIVQGMSGAPIIQNNLFVGALTHVFINDPLRGYGILGEKMLEVSVSG